MARKNTEELHESNQQHGIKVDLPLTFRDRVLHFEKFPMKFNFT